MKTLKSIEEYNAERYAALKQANKLPGNGIACARCGHEMVDSNEQYWRTSMPPKVKISCPVCGDWGYRLA